MVWSKCHMTFRTKGMCTNHYTNVTGQQKYDKVQIKLNVNCVSEWDRLGGGGQKKRRDCVFCSVKLCWSFSGGGWEQAQEPIWYT